MTDTFETFWTDYPRKDGKQYAQTCYARAVKKHGADTILRGLARFKSKMIVENRETKHIMQASRFLNQAVYLDDYANIETGAKDYSGLNRWEVAVGGRVFRYPELAKIKRTILAGNPVYEDEWHAFKKWQEAGNWTDIKLPPEPAQPPTQEERAAYIEEMKERGLL